MIPRQHRQNRRIRFVALGIVALVALSSCEAGWVNPFAGDGTAGTTTGTVADAQARFTAPTGVVAIPGGGFYVYDAATCAIYKESQGQISVYAGIPGTCGNSGDGGQATAATLDNAAMADLDARKVIHGPGLDSPTPMTLGPDGSVYFAEVTIVGWTIGHPYSIFPQFQSQVRRISPQGTITAVGNGTANSISVSITGVTTTPDGTILVAEQNDLYAGTTDIDAISADGSQSAVTTTPGLVYAISAISNTQIATMDRTSVDRVDLTTGAATPTGQAASLFANAFAATPDGTIYVGSATNNTIVRIAPDNTVTTIAGSGTADPGTTAQTGDGLSLDLTPTGLALTPNHGLLISSGHVVYRLADPAHAGPVPMGQPLNYFGGTCTYRPQSPLTPSSPITTAPCSVG